MTDRQTDRRTGKNNMSPDPVGGRHNEYYEQFMYLHILISERSKLLNGGGGGWPTKPAQTKLYRSGRKTTKENNESLYVRMVWLDWAGKFLSRV